MLLYLGAGVDLWPVRRYAHAHSTFIYVDGLPDSKYYTQEQVGYQTTSDLDVMIETIQNDLEVERAFVSLDRLPGQLVFHLRGGGCLRYFYNCLAEEMHTRPELSAMLPDITSLYLHGFAPPMKSIQHLPNLVCCYCARFVAQVSETEVPVVSLLRQKGVQLSYVPDVEYELTGRYFVDRSGISIEVSGLCRPDVER